MSENIIERHGAKVKIVPSAAGAILDCYQKYENRVELTMAVLDAMSLFGFEIIAMPETTKWLSKLKRFEKLGHIDLTDFDLEDEADLEYLFIRNLFISPDDIKTIGVGSGMDAQDIGAAIDLL